MPHPQAASRSRAPTWAKLWSIAVSANLAGLLVATWVARLVRAVPETAGAQTGLLFAYYTAMALVAFADALLLDELLFKGGFRRTHLQGYDPQRTRGDEDVGALASAMQRTNLAFPVLLLACGGLTYALFNASNGQFDDYHKRIGRHVSALAHGDEAERVAAVQRLAIQRGDELPRIVSVLKTTLAEGGEPARWAAWGLGHMTDLPHRHPLVRPLVAATRSPDPAVRLEALVALGRLQHRSSAPAIQGEIRRRLEAGEPVEPRLLYALGSIQVLSSKDLLETLLYTGEDRIPGLAAWALAQHRDQVDGRSVVAILEQRLPSAGLPLRCDIVHGLGILADERSNETLMRAYDEATPAEREHVCGRLELYLSPEPFQGDRADLFMPEDTYGMRIVATMAQMRATAPEVRAEVEPWLERLIAEPETAAAPREAAKTLLRGIREGWDESKRPSVEQALGL